MSPFLRQAVAVCRRDLMIEGRAGEVLGVILPFAAVAVFVVPLATDPLTTRLADLAFPVYWLVGLLFGMQVALRHTGTETTAQRRHIALLGVDPAARYLGRSAAATVLTLAVLALTLPLVFLFYNPSPPAAAGPVAGALVLFAVGLALLATLAGDVTVGLRARSMLAPLLVAPLSVPLLLGASQTVEALVAGRATLTWILLLVVTDLVLGAAGILTARPLEAAAT